MLHGVTLQACSRATNHLVLGESDDTPGAPCSRVRIRCAADAKTARSARTRSIFCACWHNRFSNCSFSLNIYFLFACVLPVEYGSALVNEAATLYVPADCTVKMSLAIHALPAFMVDGQGRIRLLRVNVSPNGHQISHRATQFFAVGRPAPLQDTTKHRFRWVRSTALASVLGWFGWLSLDNRRGVRNTPPWRPCPCRISNGVIHPVLF